MITYWTEKQNKKLWHSKCEWIIYRKQE